ncbi:Calcium-transporting ATPase 1 [Methanosarcinaceae archaeon Ag5]|uniref:Calcium-transporting ATPase 1 n=1 Tax=Methanolapillus africanus TaxID=3028297 RepID=A0AAE4SEF7_9EURY|nr:Calcium-transporting ATPase 1 [Methanosarcinaceae archaeon Ag5]
MNQKAEQQITEKKPETTWCSLEEISIFEQLKTDEQGLSNEEAAKRLEEFGPNKLEEGKKRSLISIFISQFANLMIWVLIAAALITAFISYSEHEFPIDSIIISVVVILNAVLGTVQEAKAESSIEALKKMAAPNARVLRRGTVSTIPAADLVAGDIVLLEAGDSVPADLRLLTSFSLKIEEAALTGESQPVSKKPGALGNVCIGDRTNMAFMGTSVTYGRGSGVVVATGMQTEIGHIAKQLTSTTKEITPLQKQLNTISKAISVLVIIIAALVFVIGYLGGQEIVDVFLTAVSLAVAAIPEGLVAVVTIVLALGMSRMAKRGALVRRLPAVETLGSTQVICSDKTGTLTQNKMTVQKVWNFDYIDDAHSPEIAPLLDALGHCNDSRLDEKLKFIGDPTETALLDYLVVNNLWTIDQIKGRKRAGEIPFDSERKRSTVAVDFDKITVQVTEQSIGSGSDADNGPDAVHAESVHAETISISSEPVFKEEITQKASGKIRIYVKGAPESIVGRSDFAFHEGQVVPMTDDLKSQILSVNEEMAANALRILAFGYKDEASIDAEDVDGTESHLIFCGLVGMIDPPRPEVAETVKTCRRAGIIPVMITGDHKTTAVAIANDLGLLDDGRIAITGADLEAMSEKELDDNVTKIGVYARVSPEHKVRIVTAWQKRGKIVAMTGDGVNDAPALKKADIGVGMGITGTDVSKSASDMVLMDDNFATIVLAVEEGRSIFDNIHKTVRFLLSSNMGEVIAILTATAMGFILLSPIHILWINLVTDTFPALALGVEPAEKDIMDRKPRDQTVPFFNKRTWGRIFMVGLVEAILALAAYHLGNTVSAATGVTMAFLTLSLVQLFAAIGFQSEHHSIFAIKPKEHPYLWLAFFGSAALQLIVVLVPFLRDIFGLVDLDMKQWIEVLILCILMLVFVELQKWVARLRHEDA